MQVLTKKEAQDFISIKTSQKTEVQKKKKISTAPPPPQENREWSFFNPELYDDFEDIIIIQGKPYNRKMVNGVIRTKDSILADYLFKKGFQLLNIELIKGE